MRKRDKILALSRIASMLKDAELQKLARSAQACTVTRMRLSQLGDLHANPVAPTLADRQAADMHDLWRLQRRILLNQTLAQETAEMLQARERAARAYGRAEVLRKLLERGS